MYYEKKYNNGSYSYYTRDHYVILSHEKNSTQCKDGFYQTVIYLKLSGENQYTVALWCEHNCRDEWLVGIDTSAFTDEADAMAFKLVWGENYVL